MRRTRLLGILAAAAVAVQVPASAQRPKAPDEERQLEQALEEAGTSPVEFIRALESHLARFPDSPRRPELERALAKAAIDNKDDRRIILYGERVLAREPDDLQLLDRVSRALISGEDKDRAGRALRYARRLEESVRAAARDKPSGRFSDAKWSEEVDRSLGRALVFQARAEGILGKPQEAAALARRSYETYPTAESAGEMGKMLAKAGKPEEAIRWYADAFTISDPRATDAFRAGIRARMGELYRTLRGSEAGLGDLVLEAYDRTAALVAERRSKLRQADPNAQVTRPGEFTLTGLDGEKLPLASLRGKVLVMDFWATWCGPCRTQHPLYQEVKERFKDRPEVLFLSINTDEEREGVSGFLKDHGWDNKVYYEDGLSNALQVSSIPTTVLLDKNGEVVSRMNGFIPGRFVDMLTQRINEALSAPGPHGADESARPNAQ